MKRRSLTVLLCLLAIISLASVGFASWVITADDTENVTGNIQVETVTDQRLDIKVADGQDLNINLLAPATQAKEGAWLVGKSEKGSEKKTVAINFTLGFKNTQTTGTPIATVTAEFDEETKTLIKKAVDANYIQEPTISIVNNGNGNYVLTINFEWGEAFGKVNPYDYYNAEGKTANGLVADDVSTTWADDAYAKLTDLNSIFADKTYKVVITAKPSETASPAPVQPDAE